MTAAGNWLQALRRYLVLIACGNLIWEVLQLPLYTLWQEGGAGEISFAVFHCTLGDVLIATACIVTALALFGGNEWPQRYFRSVLLAATAFGLAYTTYSEWVNVNVRQTWAYTRLMPTLPPLGIGLTPFLQWLILPPLCLWLSVRGTGFRRSRSRKTD